MGKGLLSIEIYVFVLFYFVLVGNEQTPLDSFSLLTDIHDMRNP